MDISSKLQFLGKTTHFWLKLSASILDFGWKVEVFGFLSVFRQYLSHLTSGKVHFYCVEIRITSRSVGCKNYFAFSILVRPYFFTFESLQDFSTELDSLYAIYYSSVFSDLL